MLILVLLPHCLLTDLSLVHEAFTSFQQVCLAAVKLLTNHLTAITLVTGYSAEG